MEYTNDLARLKEAILYVSQLSENDPKFGAVKLNKILYYADFRAYRELGRPITEAHYQHLPEGPAPRELLRARQELIGEGRLAIEYRHVFNYVQQRTVAKGDINPEVFLSWPDDRRYLDETVKLLEPMWGYQTSDMSHRERGYQLTTNGEDIPYRTAWLSSDEPTQEETEIARRFFEEELANG